MFALPLALLLFGAAGEDRGVAGIPPEEVPALRTAPRIHAAIGLGGLFGVGGYSFTGSLLVVADLGVVLRDRLSLVARAEGGSALLSIVGGFSLLAAVHLDDRWSVGAGAKFFGWQPVAYVITPSPFLGVMLPVRASVALAQSRDGTGVARSAAVLGLELAPGVSVLSPISSGFNRRTDVEFGFTAILSISYATW